MRTLWLMLLFALLAGCEGPSVSGDPVAPPPPPRIGVNLDSNQQQPTDGNVQQAKFEQPETRAVPAASKRAAQDAVVSLGPIETAEETVVSHVVATVNGEVIFAHECLDDSQFEQARKQLPPEALQSLREQIIRRELPKVIQRKLLAAEAKRILVEQQRKLLDRAAEEDFQTKLRSVLKQSESTTEAELAVLLRDQGLSLERLRARHHEEFLGQQYARAKISNQTDPSRRQLIEYYQAHRDEFALPARVRWRHIEVSTARARSRAAARRKADEIAALLSDGADFGLLAQWKSDGPNAKNKGEWDWTTRGSFAVDAVDAFLFEGEVGSVSPVIEGRDGFHLAQILERQPDRFLPFSETQDRIRERIEREQIADASQKLVVGLYEQAHVETIFDTDPAFLTSLSDAVTGTESQR